MMTILNQTRERKMSIIKDFRNLYPNLPKQEPQEPIIPVNKELMDRAVDNLNKQPLVAPNICRKPE